MLSAALLKGNKNAVLPEWCIIFAVAIRLISGASYAISVIKNKTKPNPLTWFFWGITALIAGVAQVIDGVGPAVLTTFALALGPLAIFALSLRQRRGLGHLDSFSLGCGAIALAGIIMWQITTDPLIAIAFCILADICASLPTLRKAYRNPKSEVALPYALSMLSMVITLLTINSWTFGTYAFPLYIFVINLAIYCTLKRRTFRRWRAALAQ